MPGVLSRQPHGAKRILAISNHAIMLGGGEHSFLDLISRLTQDWIVIAATPAEGELADRLRGRELATRILSLPSIRPWLLLSIFSSLWGIIRVCRKDRPGLIYANGSRAALYGGLAGRIMGIPVIWHCRVPEKDRYLDQLLSRLCHKVVVNSMATAARFQSILPAKVVTVYNGLDIDWLNTTNIAKPDLIQDGWKILIKVARISRWKRHDVVLAAFETVAADDPLVHLVCLGARDELEIDWWEELQAKTKASPYCERIHWLGQLDDVRPWYKNAHLLLLGSENEAFGRIVVEAMATGVPVVATRSGGVPEIVRDGQDGFLVPPGNADEMAVAISKILNNEDLHRQMVDSGRQRAQVFSLDSHVENMDKLFKQVLDG